VLAREHGFDSRPKVAAHLQSLMPEESPREIWRRAERAIVEGDDTVRLLLHAHSSVNVQDTEFNGTPLGWALYAWGGGGPRPGSELYYDVVAQLVAAGATVEPQWLDASSRGFPLPQRIREDPRMRAALGR